jgi:hypothetical protein
VKTRRFYRKKTIATNGFVKYKKSQTFVAALIIGYPSMLGVFYPGTSRSPRLPLVQLAFISPATHSRQN